MNKSTSDSTSIPSKSSSSQIMAHINSAKDNHLSPKQITSAQSSTKTHPFATTFPFQSANNRWWSKKKLALYILIPALILIIMGVSAAIPLLKIKALAHQLETSARLTYDSLKTQDLIAGKQHLDETAAKLTDIEHQYRYLTWFQFTPLRWHYQDGQHLLTAAKAGINAGHTLLSALEPYADVLGFKGQGSFTGGTAEERIVKIIETLDKVTPTLDQVATDLTTINHQLAQINPNRYPVHIRNRSIPELIHQVQDFSNTAVIAVTDVKPLLEVIPKVAGINQEKKYLVLFQNDAELRPTGGFMTAYGILRVDKGRVFQEKSDDIYNLDQKFNSRLKPPVPITKYLDNVFYWYLRDMNLSPDFKISMDTFLDHYLGLPDEPEQIDGVIAVDTQILSDLIKVLGAIEVPGFGAFTAEIDPRCNCPQVIYELEDYATRPVAYVRSDRKAFLAPMLQTMLVKAYGSPKQVWPSLFQTVVENVRQKHVLFYMFDQESQTAAETVGIAGRITEYDGDYFHLNEANFGGAKSNMFITHKVEDEISISDQGTTHDLTLTYKNPMPWSDCNLESGGLCLNGKYRGFMRFYLPKGTQLNHNLGFHPDSIQTYEELGKTVIEGFFEFVPESQSKLKLNYTVPYFPQDQYKLFIQKQPGQKQPGYTLVINGQEKQEFELKYDKEIIIDL